MSSYEIFNMLNEDWNSDEDYSIVAGGVITGGGECIMHYIGMMAGLCSHARVIWNGGTVFASCLIQSHMVMMILLIYVIIDWAPLYWSFWIDSVSILTEITLDFHNEMIPIIVILLLPVTKYNHINFFFTIVTFGTTTLLHCLSVSCKYSCSNEFCLNYN